jgi:polyisoprenoid-binding protein YceI
MFAGDARRTRLLHALVSLGGLVLMTNFSPAVGAELPLNPSTAEVVMRAWGMGLLPVDGTFRQFSGTLAYQSLDFAQCAVSLTVHVASLAMSDETRRADILSPEFLDAARFPTLTYRGACSGGDIDGTLVMHGVTHPLSLKLDREGQRLTVEGSLDRRAWGMTAKPFMVGSTIRIRVIVQLP